MVQRLCMLLVNVAIGLEKLLPREDCTLEWDVEKGVWGGPRALGRQVQAQLELRRNLKRLATSLAARDRAEAEKDLALRELRAALANIRTLEGLLPICLSCKKIQDKKGDWQPFEYYVRSHSEAKVTHKLCPDCTKAISA